MNKKTTSKTASAPLVLADIARDLHNHREAMAAPLRQLQQQVQAFHLDLEPLRKIGSDIDQALEPLFDFGPVLDQALTSMRQLGAGIQRSLEQPLKEFREWLRELPEATRLTVGKLAEIGWYIDPNMSVTTIHTLARALTANDVDAADSYFEEFFYQRVNEIEQELVEAYEHRRTVLQDVFEAHRSGKYNLSIPVFLAQADGIWWDRFGKNLFIKWARTQAADDVRDELRSEFSKKLFDVFDTSIPIWKSESERSASFEALNRHQVLHGESTTYGTQRNSLQCISFLSFLHWVLRAEPAPGQ